MFTIHSLTHSLLSFFLSFFRARAHIVCPPLCSLSPLNTLFLSYAYARIHHLLLSSRPGPHPATHLPSVPQTQYRQMTLHPGTFDENHRRDARGTEARGWGKEDNGGWRRTKTGDGGNEQDQGGELTFRLACHRALLQDYSFPPVRSGSTSAARVSCS